jgi:aspartate kinase
MKVLKFGGTSLATAQRMQHVANLVTQSPEPKFVVLSAVSGTTNSLVELGNKLKAGKKDEALQLITKLHQKYENFLQELYSSKLAREEAEKKVGERLAWLKQACDKYFSEALEKEILAQGELLSTGLFFVYLKEQDVAVNWIPALDMMRTNEEKEPDIAFLREKLNDCLNEKAFVYLTQGYICRNYKDEIDNLQRGGSDYTASLIGAALKASEIQIWTDIDGMHNNDPRVVENTYPVAELSFDEAAELAYFGAKILHPFSIRPAQQYDVPIRLLNTMQPEANGTRITSNPGSEGFKAVAVKDKITAIKVKSSRMLLAYGFLRRIFEVFEKYRTPIDMITTSEVAVSLTIDNSAFLEEIISELGVFGEVEVDRNHSIVCIAGTELVNRPAIMKQVGDALGSIPLRMISYGGSNYNISLLVDTRRKNEVLNLLNKGLFIS